MTRDDLSSAIMAKRAELEALETEAKTLPFTTDEQNKINFAYDAIMYLYGELGGERQPEQCSNDHRVRFKVISALEARLAAVDDAKTADEAMDMKAKIEAQAATIAKLEADLANAYIPPKGYEVFERSALFHRGVAEIFLMPKGGAK